MSVRVTRVRGGAAQLLSGISVPNVSGNVIAVVVSAFVAAEIGVAAALKPTAALLVPALLGGILLLVDARARALFIVFGGLLTLQSSDSFGHLKLLYLAGVFVSFGGALFTFSRTRDSFRRGCAKPLLRVSVAVGALIAVSLFVARGHGVARTDWLRDAAPYILFALAPFFALDAQWAMSRKALVRLLVLAGSVATASFATHWLEQRHIAQLPFSRFALSSFYLPAALFAYAIAAALQANRRRMRWMALAALVLALLIVTGTRSTLILVCVPLVAVIGARRHLSARFVRLVLVAPVALMLMVGAAYGVAAATHASSAIISKRIAILEKTGTSSDASYVDRQAQTHVALQTFYANPVFGAGPGTYFAWTVTNGEKRSAFIIDSPTDFPAKYGIVGLGVVGFLLVSYVSFFRSVFRVDHPRPETLAMAAYAVVVVTNSILTNPLEDKGLTLGLILLLALVFSTWPRPASPPANAGMPATAAA
jgi:hypothetical protein